MPSIYGDYSKNVRLRIDYTIRQNDEDIANNRSVLSLNLYAEKTAHYGHNETGQSYYNMSGKNNTTVYWNWSSGSSEYYLGNSEVIVPHNTDGTGSTTLYGYWYLARSSNYMPTEISITKTISLPRIPRKSEITLSGIEVTLGNNITINTNRASNSFTHALYYQIDGGSWNTFATGVGASYTWTVPLTIANSLPNTTGKTINIICETYNGTSYIGSSVAPLYVYIPDSVVPSITAFNLSGGSSNGTYVEDLTNVNATVSATGAYSSSISSYKVELIKGSTVLKTSYGSSVSFPLTNINLNSQDTNLTLKATVTDSRGRNNTSTKTINVKYYYKPFFNSYNAYRSDASGNRSDSGTYIDLSWHYSVRSISGVLTFTKTLRYRQVGTTNWTNVDLANNTSVITGGGNISTNYQYEVQFYISDGFNSAQKTLYVQTGYSTVDYRAGGKGIAFGKASEKDEFECNMIADFKKSISWNTNTYNNANANDFTKSGMYYLSEGCTNTPATYCRIIVNGNEQSGDITQIATNFTSEGNMWIRHKVNSVWGNWVKVAHQPIIATAFLNARTNVSGNAWTSIKIPLDNIKQYGGRLSLENNGIKIGSRISKIKISANLCWFQYSPVGEFDLNIVKNNQTVAMCFGNNMGSHLQHSSVTPVVIEVTEGDMLYLMINKGSAGEVTILQNSFATNLTVEVLE